MEAISEIEPTLGLDKGQAWYRCSEGTSIGPVPGALCRRWRALGRRRRRASKSEEAARIEVVIPAVEAGLQRGTLVMQTADNQFTRRGGLQSK